MSKKQFLISIIAIVVISVGSSVLMIVLEWNDSISSSILWGLIILLIGYTYLRYRISAPLQRFSSKFNMLVDYDLDIELAKNMAFQGMQEAPFNNIKQYYQMYYSMALYYSGEYSEAIKYFHLLDLKKLNPIYQVLIFSITAYCAYEIDDQEEFDQSLDRVKALETHITGRYHGYAASYVDILDSIKNIDTDPETYRVMVEKHFGKQDGYITTQLNYKYRMAIYYQKVGNIEEMDKCLAFVIANGKQHHTALRAKEMFKGTVKVEDYIVKDEAPETEEDSGPDNENAALPEDSGDNDTGNGE